MTVEGQPIHLFIACGASVLHYGTAASHHANCTRGGRSLRLPMLLRCCRCQEWWHFDRSEHHHCVGGMHNWGVANPCWCPPKMCVPPQAQSCRSINLRPDHAAHAHVALPWRTSTMAAISLLEKHQLERLAIIHALHGCTGHGSLHHVIDEFDPCVRPKDSHAHRSFSESGVHSAQSPVRTVQKELRKRYQQDSDFNYLAKHVPQLNRATSWLATTSTLAAPRLHGQERADGT